MMVDCPDLAVPREVMQHVVHVESSRNPFAIGVVGGYLARQPKNLDEALATVRQLKVEGYNFSVGISQVNRYNLAKYGLKTYEQAFEVCPNLQAGSRILRECYDRAQDWGKAFSCYYSGNFATGFQHGYVQKIFASIRTAQLSTSGAAEAIRVVPYNASSRKRSHEDDVPLRGTVQAAAEAGHLQNPALYPEPSSVRKHISAKPSSLTTTASSGERYGGARNPSSAPPDGVETAETRSATPVPGPGAVMPDAAGSSLSRIPTQVVGVNGDPYQTKVVLSAPLVSPANRPPLAQQDVQPVLSSGGPTGKSPYSRTSGTPPKGGTLLNAIELSAKTENPAEAAVPRRLPVDQQKQPANADRSFVF